MSDFSVRINKYLKDEDWSGAVRRASTCAGKFLASFSCIKCGWERFTNPFDDVNELSGDWFHQFNNEFMDGKPGSTRLTDAAKRADRIAVFMKKIDQHRMRMEVSFFEKKGIICRLVVKLSCHGQFTGWEWK